MKFYVSKCHDRLNGVPYTPEKYGKYICINPYYNVTIKDDSVKFPIDSGAFQDVGTEKRLTFEEALERQLEFEYRVTKSHRPAEAIVSYDRLVDEQFGENGQYKARVSEEDSKIYVQETIDAARFLASKREELAPRKLVLSCQGTTVEQYLYCLKEVLKVAKPRDIIGFGGFCIISKSKVYEEQFYKVIEQAFPLIKKKGIRRVHIFGVGMFRALIQAEICAKLNGITCSYDTSSCEINSVFGKVFDPVNAQLITVFSKEQKRNGYTPAQLAEFNVNSILQFWKNFKSLPLPDNFTPGLITNRAELERKKRNR